MEIIIIILVALVAFIATNLDDIFILMSYFALVNDKMNVVIGQYLGFAILLTLSLLCYQFKFLVPGSYLTLLGLFPIIIGIKYLWNFRRDISAINNLEKSFGPSSPNMETVSREPQKTLQITLTTVANGGDNMAVYIPLFMTMDNIQLGITILTFMVMLGLWCILAYKMVNNWIFGEKLKLYGHAIFPFILIIIGFSIIFRNLQIFL